MAEKPSVMITGSRGFIGRASVHHFLGRGYAVRAIDKKIHPRAWSANIWADVTDVGKMDQYFNVTRPDYVLHLAAQSSLQESIKDPVQDAKDNILGTINVAMLCKKYDVQRLVYASTSSIYKGVIPWTEDALMWPETPYALSKYTGEEYIRLLKIPHVILRYGNVYGPTQVPVGENQLIPRFLAHRYLGHPFVINGDGTQKRDFVYIDDVLEANELALTTEIDEVNPVFNISSGIPVSVNAVIANLIKYTEFEGEIEHGPGKDEPQDVYMNCSKAYHVLGWRRITSMSVGLKKVVDAWRSKLT